MHTTKELVGLPLPWVDYKRGGGTLSYWSILLFWTMALKKKKRKSKKKKGDVRTGRAHMSKLSFGFGFCFLRSVFCFFLIFQRFFNHFSLKGTTKDGCTRSDEFLQPSPFSHLLLLIY